MRARLAISAALLTGLSLTATATAGTFGAVGEYRLDPEATASLGFEVTPERFLPDDADASCADPMFEVTPAAEAIEGESLLQLRVKDGCAERLVFPLPADQASYRATVWMRHGGIDAAILVLYEDGSGLDTTYAQMSPTGRTTSDGWVEMATNEFPVDGQRALRSYLRVISYGAKDAVEIDALEVVRRGTFTAQSACDGVADPVCGPEGECVYGRCVLGRLGVPVLPSDEIRDEVVDTLKSQIRLFYGGQRSRELYLPDALAKMEEMRYQKTAWGFWRGFAAAIHALHDWHTSTYQSITGTLAARGRLNACFIEGDADLSHGAWPKDPAYADILVSHVGGADNAGLRAGDRLIAVDGQHPIAWVESLKGHHFGYHTATDPAVFADHAEALGGPAWAGALIVRLAHEMTVLRCDPSGVCADKPETILVSTLAGGGGGQDVSCDNRPFYHLEGSDVPNPATHRIFGRVFRGTIAGTTPEEAIHGMVWDTLYGGGDPNGPLNSAFNAAITDWKASARGVILDHRAGNGGTLDAAENLTRLVRPREVAAVMRAPMEVGGFDGPSTPSEGVALFNGAKNAIPFEVGDDDWAVGLPVALILHRDGSASDYLPYGMKGAPNTRLFGPHATAGAFSTFIELSSWGGLYYQIASGDTIAKDGSALIGHGVVPDEIVLPRQSDLLAGKDTLFEAALAWVRQELEP